jgi:hypothetical protein
MLDRFAPGDQYEQIVLAAWPGHSLDHLGPAFERNIPACLAAKELAVPENHDHRALQPETTPPGAKPVGSSRRQAWLLFLAGILLCIAGPAAYMLQFSFKHLSTPWYMPGLALAGVALMVLSLWHRRGIVRALLLVPFVLMCGFEWYGIAIASRSPAYNGPGTPGAKLPGFTAKLADGRPFTESDLEKGESSALVFYRGRW